MLTTPFPQVFFVGLVSLSFSLLDHGEGYHAWDITLATLSGYLRVSSISHSSLNRSCSEEQQPNSILEEFASLLTHFPTASQLHRNCLQACYSVYQACYPTAASSSICGPQKLPLLFPLHPGLAQHLVVRNIDVPRDISVLATSQDLGRDSRGALH